ncbi:hypothetical protein ECED1_5135 [Escherichia coli ED1a]|uniref:Uncharacterized protein n=1 Tax=Escherichia coli O81 (strain ED1a) TaxID=585397 RepID=B7MT14_ECO81|nr:hypothetical protein ECED1_5135 [Escherichia coli ED1a]
MTHLLHFIVKRISDFARELQSVYPRSGKVFAFADWTVAVPVATAPSLNSAELATFAFGTKHTPILTRMLCP